MREDWKIMRLGDIVEIKRGLTYSKNDEVETSEKIVLRSNNVNLDNHQFDFTELKYLKPSFDIPADKYLQKGDLLMCMSNGSKAHLGKVALYEGDCNKYAFGGFMAALSHKDNVIGKYLFYAMITPTYKEYIKALSDGANINNLKVRDIEAYSIPVPPLSEQERIVSLLDAEFAKIDALKANAATQLQAAKDLFQSALKQLLAPKEGWEIKTLGEICEVTDYVANGSFATLKENVTYYNEPNYAILVRLADYSSSFDKTKFVYVDKHSYDFLSKSSLFGGEIIMSNVGSIGKCFICPDLGQPMTIGPNSLLIRTPNPPYFHYYFQSQLFQDKLKTITSQATLSKFNKTQFRDLSVFLPSLPEQERIAARLDEISEKVKSLQANYDRTVTLCNDLKQALLKSIFA